MNPLSTRPNRWRPITVFNLLVGLLFSFSALAQPAFLKDGLVAYYPFNGNANDESGNQFNGIIEGGSISTNRFGENNSSCRCDGKRLAATVPNFIVSGNNISVSFWFNALNFDYTKGVRLLTHNWDGVKPYGSFTMDSLYGGLFRGTADAETYGFYVKKVIPTNVWQHWVLTFNGNSVRFYTNGIFAGAEYRAMNLRQSKSTLYIGGDNPGNLLNGDIDDVRIYNRALPDTEVKALYAYESTPPDNSFITNGLVAYYPFNGNANDESGNANNGVVLGARLSTDRFGNSDASFRCNGKERGIVVPNFPVSSNSISIAFWYQCATIDYARGMRFLSHNWDGEKPYGAFGVDSLFGGIFRGTQDSEVLGCYLQKPIPTNIWQHILITCNGNAATLYTNGVLAASKYGSIALRQVKSTLYIGGDFYFLDGDIDDIRIYNRALSDTEVKALYDYESTPPDNSFITNGLVAYYPFNGNANDASGNSNHGNPTGYISFKTNRFGNYSSSLSFQSKTIGGIDLKLNQWTNTFNLFTISYWYQADFKGMQNELTDSAGDIFCVGSSANHTNSLVNHIYLPSGQTNTAFLTTFQAYATGATHYNFERNSNWHHVVISYDGSTLACYNDGLLVDSQIMKVLTQAKQMLIGRGFWSGEQFIGSIDDFRIYNKPLSSLEVKSLYEYELNPPLQSPVILLQPTTQSAISGDDVILSVGLQVAGIYNYQWQLNEQNISGATTSSLAVNNAVAGIYRYRVIVSNSAGTVISDSATLTVVTPPPPTITTQPVGKTVQEGSNVSFAVVASGQGALVYQWQLNEQNLPGATSATLNLNSVKQNQSGRYRVLVSSPYGVTISDNAILTVNPNPPPTIVTQPIGKTVQEGANVSFNVVATGVGSITYQWQFNEQNLPGATSATLNLNGVKLNTAGRYRVLISSQYGVTISDTVTLAVNPNPPPTIVTQPLSRTPAEGTQVSLTVTATGLGSLTYQWQINNQNIPGATSSTLVLSAARPSANGKYRVIVGNPYGTTISTEATVAVVVTDTDSDGLSDYEELLLGTNANTADSDGDGLSDFAEVRTHGCNPLTTDTDGDGYSDGIEVARDGNPNNRSVTPTGALAVFPAVDVEFYTLNGVKYQLEVSTDMVAWTAQGGLVVGNGGSQNHLVRASKATQFWRLKVVQ